MRSVARFVSALCMLGVLFVYPAVVTAQYMYLDTNGNGVHDAGDILNSPGNTSVDIWLKTNQNRNGTTASCTNGSGAMSIRSYEFILHVQRGSVAWVGFNNLMSSFTFNLGEASSSSDYHNGFGGSEFLAPGTYRLGTMIVTASETAYITIAATTNLLENYKTSFYSECLGLEFDNTPRLGLDWFGTDGAGRNEVWTPNGVKLANDTFGIQLRPTIVQDGAGGCIAAWHDLRDPGTAPNVYSQRLDSSGLKRWAQLGVNISPNIVFGQVFPLATPDGASGAFVVWDDDRNQTWDVYVQRVAAAGGVASGWPAGGVGMATGAGHQHRMPIVPNGNGGAIVSWQSDSTGFGGPFSPWISAIDANGVKLWASNGIRLDSQNGGGGPLVTNDGAGGAIAIWSRGGMRVQRINASGTALWGTDGIVLSSASAGAGLPVPDGSGGAILGWIASGHLFVQRINSSGAIQWASGGVEVCPPGGTQSGAQIISDGAGGAIMCWRDDRPGLPGIYARAIGADGTLRWNLAGIPVCATPPGVMSTYIMSEDAAGGAVFAWQDDRSLATSGRDIYAQRVDRGGVVKWALNGVVVSNAASSQDYLTATGDGVGGVFAAWEDRRSSPDTFYIYAARISPQGANYITEVASVPIVSQTSLEQNRPNPFNPRTSVRFNLPRAGEARFTIFDASGRLVRRLLHERLVAGAHEVSWNGLDGRGREAPSGVYYYLLEAPGVRESRRMVLAK